MSTEVTSQEITVMPGVIRRARSKENGAIYECLKFDGINWKEIMGFVGTGDNVQGAMTHFPGVQQAAPSHITVNMKDDETALAIKVGDWILQGDDRKVWSVVGGVFEDAYEYPYEEEPTEE